ncbi:MFS transporter [Asanoa ishikariensis]|uniref:Major Facilitator Superfamily protein n=1 Tax=Asanoa ishikariensis TaxID=137265 RepID=A0A1H3UMY6_9ACTN|nr:MFS transporter [Asanoa ishikariensis]GIF69015.1 MFS transporter [Asanoa ishikariensis]SDZ63738.1 Major Facilitator Superfamily protein [Asanoa ishikariensis]
MFRDVLPQRPEARRLLAATFFSATGRGLTLPFMYIYLTDVRHLPSGTAGLVIGWMAVCALAIGALGGWAVDRYGARRVVLPMLLVEAVGVGSVGFAHTAWQALASVTLVGAGGGVIWAANTTILSSVTDGLERQKTFGLSFALLNLGIGAGTVIAGSIVDSSRPGTFQLVYLIDASLYLVPFVNLLTMPGVGRRLAPDGSGAAPTRQRQPGYREVFAHRGFRRLLLFSIVLTISGYAQLEVGFTAFSVNVAQVTPQVVAYAFTANTLVIVLAQLFVVRLIQGRSRTRLLSVVGVIMAASWLILAVAGVTDNRNTAIAIVAVIACAAVFAFGETLLSPISPTLLNSLATDELRGRFNALGAMVWGISGIVGPITAAPLIGGGHSSVWLGLTVAGCLISAVLAASLRKVITAEQDGRVPSAAPDEPGGAAPTENEAPATPATAGR